MTTPYMALTIPSVQATLGPAYATQVNAAFGLVDAHDHTSGKGTTIPTAGLLINADLGFNGFDAKSLRAARFGQQSGSLASSVVDAIYDVSGDLYWNNGSGAAVQITSGTSVAGTSGSIGGLSSPAALTYSSITKTFTFTQDSGFPAKVATGDILLYETASAVSNAVTLKSPTSLAAGYSLTMPTAVPATPALLQMSTGGALSVVSAPGATTSLLQSTTGGTLSFVTTLPSGLTIPGPTITGGLALTGAAVLSTPSTGAVDLAALSTDVFGVAQSAGYFLTDAGTRSGVRGRRSKEIAGMGLDVTGSYISKPQTTQTGTTTNTSATITGLSDTTAYDVGTPVTGAGIPADTVVLSIDSPTQIHISANATANGTPSLTFGPGVSGINNTAQTVKSITLKAGSLNALGRGVRLHLKARSNATGSITMPIDIGSFPIATILPFGTVAQAELWIELWYQTATTVLIMMQRTTTDGMTIIQETLSNSTQTIGAMASDVAVVARQTAVASRRAIVELFTIEQLG